jgi:NAD(P)-dependent dehydrogenase (short-subunit alcohol dehydrogenase family)
MPPWSLVSPASRGIGFALARRVLQTTTAPVVATARKDLDKTKEELLEGLDVDKKRLTVLKLDFLGTWQMHRWTSNIDHIIDEATIADAASSCKKQFSSGSNHLQLGFIVPGILFPEKSPAQINADDALLTFRTNTLGPMLMLKHFSPFLPKKSTTVDSDREDMEGLPSIATTAIMSARVGSIGDNRLGGWYSYRASKAGVNQAVKTFDNHLRTASGDNAMAIAMHPGTVKTSLSKDFWSNVKKEKLFERDWVAERLIDVIKEVGVEGRGKCWDWDGKEVPPWSLHKGTGAVDAGVQLYLPLRLRAVNNIFSYPPYYRIRH